MDQKIFISTEQEGDGFYVAQFKTAELAIFSYYIESEHQAVLIDPTLDTKVYQELLNKRGATLKHVCLSHYHADFLSGHTQFKVPVIMGPDCKRAINSFQVTEYVDGKSFELGKVSIQVIHTPGHTLESSCYLLYDANKNTSCLFSGDTVFLGEVGRPDLAVNNHLTTTDLAEMLFHSIEKLKKLDPHIRLYPGHGSGSACGKKIGTGNYCILENQFKENYGFIKKDKEEFVKAAIEGIPQPPSYFFYDAKLNQVGPQNYDELLKKANVSLSLQEFQKMSEELFVMDTRSDVGEGIIKKSYWLPSKGAISNWLASVITPETSFIIICDQGAHESIIERFLRIGYFNIKGYNGFNISQWKHGFVKPEILNFAQTKDEKGVTHLDVRSKVEYDTTGVVEHSVLIPLPELESRVGDLRDYENIHINCRTGLRARVAFSILARHGIKSKVLSENFEKFEGEGFKLVKV